MAVAAIGLTLAPPAAVAAAAPAACAPGKAPAVAVAEVVDGGTLSLADGRVVILAGFDPPLAPLASTDASSPLFEAARASLAQLVAGGPVHVVPTAAAPDRYGRIRGNVFLDDGRSLAAAEVAFGYGRVHRLTGDPACTLALLDIERGARQARRGMWADPEYRLRSALEPSLAGESGLYELVAGGVVSVGHGDTLDFVDFGRDYGHDFTVLVTPAVAKEMAAAGIDLGALPGRRVVVRGMIEASGGPAIRLESATDIEIIGDGDE
jgi:endonuclease YncB( thermonuclease family)